MAQLASMNHAQEGRSLWQRPVWHWWWSAGLSHYRSVLYDWIPQAIHSDLSEWDDARAEKFPAVHLLLLTVREYENLPPMPPDRPILAVVFTEFHVPPVKARPIPTWLIPWQVEQGLQHPRLIRLVREIESGIMAVNEYPAREPIPSSFSDWLADIQARILATEGTVVLGEISSLPFISQILADVVQEEAQKLGRQWTLLGPFEAREQLKGGLQEWLRPGRNHRNQLVILYGEETVLRALCEKPRPSNVFWFWMPRLSQLTHTWQGLIPYFPRPFVYPFIWTLWGWRKFTLHNWPDDMGSVLRAWDRLSCLACQSAAIVTAQQVQLLVAGHLPADVPEPLATLVTNVLHRLMREGRTQGLLDDVIALFEQMMINEVAKNFKSLKEATRFLGLSRATLIKKMKRFDVTHPWQRRRKTDESPGTRPLNQ